MGTTIIFDTDDLVFEPQLVHWHRGVERLSRAEKELYADGVQRYLATLEASDFVTTATPLLSELARRRNKIAFTHRNALGREMQALADQLHSERQRRAAGDRVVIGYGSGTPTHDVDFQQAVPALLDIMARYAQAELWLAGPLELPESLHVFADRVRRYPLQDWQGWFRLASNFDINLAPLEPRNLFCRAKSEIKFVEAGALGIPTIATRIDAFVDAITPGMDGFLAGSESEWVESISALIERPELRTAVGSAARQTVIDRYSPAARAQDLGATVAQITGASTTIRTAARGNGTPSGPRKPAEPVATPVDTQATHAAMEMEMDSGKFTPLVINWLVSEPFRGSGGHTTLFRMVEYLVEFGHECHLYIPPIQGRRAQ